MAQTLHWPRHQAVEASALATSSCICMKIASVASVPPRLFGSSARYIPFSTSAVTTGSRQPPRPFDLVGFAHDQGASARARSARSIAFRSAHASPRASSRFSLSGNAMVAYPPDTIKLGAAVSCRGAAEIERLSALGWEAQRYRNRGKANGEGAGMQPRVAMEGVEHEPAGPGAQRHAEACEGRNRAEHRCP